MPQIVPTVGRKVWFYRSAAQVAPIDATVIAVHATPEHAHPGTACNLFCVDPDGRTFTMSSVCAADEPVDHPHFRWMPYQQTQAAKQATEGSTHA
jgi:hypothetical protein